jgi:hypothetical protein
MGQLFSSTEMRSRVGRWVKSLTAAGALLAFALLAPGSAAAVNIPDASPEQICGRADVLTSQKRFDDALQLIVAARGSVVPPGTLLCEQERLNAIYKRSIERAGLPEVAITFGQSTSRTICGLANRLTRTDRPAQALALIDSLREPAAANPDIPGGARLAVACEQARLNAIAWLNDEATPEPTWAENIDKHWSDALATVVHPLSQSWLALIGAVAVWLVIARLLVLVPWPPVKFASEKRRTLLGTVGFVLLLVSPLPVITFWGTTNEPEQEFKLLVVLSYSVAMGCVGSWAVSQFLASRLALKITTNGKKEGSNPLEPSEVIAHLSQLGAAPPRGLEVSASTDVTALSDIISPALPSNAVTKAIIGFFEQAVGLSPWQVTVDASSSTRSIVSITRNGRAVAAQSIDLAALDIPATNSDVRLQKLAAAFILVTLASHHPGFEALGGATKWDSVGRQYIALTELRTHEDNPQRQKLLRSAVEADYLNLPAQVALKHSLYRDASTKPELTLYLNWLYARSSGIEKATQGLDGDGYIDIHRRILISYFAALHNLIAVSKRDRNPVTASDWPCEQLGERLVRLLDNKRSPELRDMMRLNAGSLLSGLVRREETLRAIDSWALDRELASASPRLAYNLACAEVRSSSDRALKASTRGLLERAFHIEELKKWAPKDPEFERLHNDQDFRQLVGKWPRATFWELELFSGHKKQLESAGVNQIGDIYASFDTVGLSNYLKVPTPVAQHMIRVSALAHAAEAIRRPRKAHAVRVEIVDQLVSLGVNRPTDHAWRLREQTGRHIVKAISATVTDRTWRNVRTWRIRRWLRRLAKTWSD